MSIEREGEEETTFPSPPSADFSHDRNRETHTRSSSLLVWSLCCIYEVDFDLDISIMLSFRHWMRPMLIESQEMFEGEVRKSGWLTHS